MVVGTPCPVITGLTFIKGQPVPIGSAKGQVLVLEFWATWCGPCVQSIPHLTALQAKYKDKGVTLVGINTEDDVQRVRRFVDGKGSTMDYTVAIDQGGQATMELLTRAQVRGIPHALIVDASNTIVYSGHPMDPAFETALKGAADKGTAAPAAQDKVALPLITQSYDELMAMSIKELKALLAERGISMAGAAEKSDLAKLLIERASKVTYYK